MPKQTTLWTAVVASLFLAPAVLAQDTAADQVVATVNGMEITLGHVAITREQLPEQYQALPPDMLFDGIVEQLIQQTVLAQSLALVPSAVEMSIDNQRRTALAGAAVNEILSVPLDAEAVQAAYAARFEGAEPEQEFNASHILVETEEKAQEIVKLLADGGDFSALAQEHSTGPSGPNGGSLGWFGEGMMVQPFEAAVVALEAGQVSDPVQTQFGWHVIILNESRVVSAPPLEEIRAELESEIRNSDLEARIAELVEKAEVTRTEKGSIDPQSMLNETIFDE